MLRLTPDRPAGRGLLALLALPVLCCVGHAVLLAAGVGSVTVLVGGVSGSVLLVGLGLLLAVGAVVVLRRRERVRR